MQKTQAICKNNRKRLFFFNYVHKVNCIKICSLVINYPIEFENNYLCILRDNPAERLGYQKGGISEIQKHK